MSKRIELPVAAAMALALSYVPAQAADAIFDTAPAPSAPVYDSAAPLPSWTGVYAGVTLGYGFGDTSLDTVPGVEVDTNGIAGGLFGGAQYQFDNFVVGAETDIGYNWNKGDDAGYEVESGFDGSLRARLGYAATDRVLVYGTGGLAYGRTEVSDGIMSDDKTLVGWTAGAGVDLKMTEMMFGRVEYRYTDYGNKTFNLSGGPVEVDAKQSKIMLGVGVQF